MLTIDELDKMQSAVQGYQRSVDNLEKFKKLSGITFYFEGEYSASPMRGDPRIEIVRKALVEYYEKDVDIKQSLLYNIGISVPNRK